MSKIQSESNSQPLWLFLYNLSSCDQYVKDTIWKQFTTQKFCKYYNFQLWPICQRYNLKAIHNNMPLGMSRVTVVTNMSKIQSESNSQRWPGGYAWRNSCDQYVKDTIWKQFTTRWERNNRRNELWPICQRYNLKAIHNIKSLAVLGFKVVTNMSKIQSESNSQLQALDGYCVVCCDQYVKDTIWKQFTTLSSM